MDDKHEKGIKAKLIKCEDVEDVDFHFKHLRILGNELIQQTRFNNLIEFLNALSNKKRLIILNILKEKDRCVCELEAVLDESQPSISHHLKILERVGLIKGWKKGKFTHYDLIEEKIRAFIELLTQELI
ncbi:MAG: helix-turn-helix transcriptional regulator [Promethearchaeota archaeon]|nr:MAG: helix-turn-helix transcriptional regulator [Candidatus Lokiarchaeota archaeon]